MGVIRCDGGSVKNIYSWLLFAAIVTLFVISIIKQLISNPLGGFRELGLYLVLLLRSQ